MSAGVSRTLLIAWAIILVGSFTWPFLLIFGSGSAAFALRDMMVLPHPYLTHSSLGFGDLPGRNAPQDAVLAVVGAVVPATWFVAVLMVVAAGVAAWVGALVASQAGGPGRVWSQAAAMAAAMTVAVWNPFVVERLVQGQWSLAVAAWLLPAVAVCRGPGQILAMWGASLTPTGGLLALVTGVATNRRWYVVLAGLLSCAPWLVPGLLSPASGTSLSASPHAFAPRAEHAAGTLGALLGLGGIWNGDAVPASRAAGFAVFGVVLFLLLTVAAIRGFVPRPLLILAGVGFSVPLFGWLLPSAMGWIVSTVPGAGLLRDSQKFVALALPAFVVAAGSLGQIARYLPAAALGLAVLQVPDAPRAVAVLAPVQVSTPAIDHDGRDVFFIDRPTLVNRADGLPVVDPATKAMNVVESGALVVDGVEVDEPSPRWRAASVIFAGASDDPVDADPAMARYFSDPGVGLVVHPDGTVEDTGVGPQPRSGVGLLAVWFAVPLVALVALVARSSAVVAGSRR